MTDSRRSLLLTGGTGFFGRALLRHLSSEAELGRSAFDVTVLTRSPDDFLSRYSEFNGIGWLRFHTGDILDPHSLPPEQNFSHILHAATDSTVGPQLSPLQRYQQIVDGTRNLLDYAIKCNAKRFLLTSSGGVYGPQPADMERIPETYHGMPDPLVAANAYSVAKRAAEHLCALYNDAFGLETVIARCFAFVGQDLPLNAHFAIGNFIRDALWRDEIIVRGDGKPLRSYLDQRDLANWLLVLLEQGRPNQTYNVGSDQPISIYDLACIVRDVLSPGKSVQLHRITSDDRGCNRYIPDISRVQHEFHLQVTIALRQAIQDTATAISKRNFQ